MRGHGKTPPFRTGMKSSLIVMYRPYQPLTIVYDQCKGILTNGVYKDMCNQAQETDEDERKTTG